jgi:hypothetical protein
MHCLSCNRELTDREATRKYVELDEFIDLCHTCTIESGILFKENPFVSDQHDDEEYIPTDEEVGYVE